MRAVLVAIALACVGAAPAFAKTCAITDYGAIANDEALDDDAIRAAIADCGGTGGTVHVPAGIFLTGGVALVSDMTLHLGGGAVLRGAPDLAAYSRFATGDAEGARGLVLGLNVKNVTITGTGTLDGNGGRFRTDLSQRPDFTLGLMGCSNVRVRDVSMVDPSKYHVRMNGCTDVVYDGISIRADMLAPNSDGIQVRDSANIRIANCLIETGDDAIVLKSRHRMVERITITNCNLISDDAAIKFGTGSAPGMRHVNVSNVTITRSRYGVALFMQDGGIFEHNRFSDMVIETGGRHAREYPIFVDIDTRQPDDPRGWGRIRGLSFDGLDITTRGNILIQGQPDHDIEDLSLSNITVRVAQAVDLATVNGKPRGNKAHAPRTGAADHSPLNGQIVIGHARGVTLSNVHARAATPADARPLLVTRDVKELIGAPPSSGDRRP